MPFFMSRTGLSVEKNLVHLDGHSNSLFYTFYTIFVMLQLVNTRTIGTMINNKSKIQKHQHM